jgi:hypothetical protein
VSIEASNWRNGILIICETATEEFDELCFQFGIELDDDVSVDGCRAQVL